MKILEMTIFTQGLLTKIFNFVFPPRDSEQLLATVNNETVKNLYRPSEHLGITYISDYSEAIIKTAVTLNKFSYHPQAAEVLANLLTHWIKEQKTTFIFIPIPISKGRYRQRGHNQVETILKKTTGNFIVRTDLLSRIKNTEPQTNLRKTARQKNLTDAFICNSKIKNLPLNTVIVLLDDVVTTGSTLHEAKKAIVRELPPTTRIVSLAIAH